WALTQAARHGLPTDAKLRREVTLRSYSFLKEVDRAIQGTYFVDPVMEASEFLAFGKEIGVPASTTTSLHARRLASLQRPDGHCRTFDARPPQSYSSFMITALAVKTLNEYLPSSMQEELATRTERAKQWLLNAAPISTEDVTYRLLGLYW